MPGTNSAGATPASLRVAVGLITAHIGDVDIAQADLIDTGEEARVIRCLTLVASALIRATSTPPETDQFLQSLGAEAARALAGDQ